ncbi:MAG: hypothetical protein D3914_06025 [Candidatus Electrothrix sp. LOE2]|nr:hypothetical protein [Candidatus Electrothrix sp. LOE2]
MSGCLCSWLDKGDQKWSRFQPKLMAGKKQGDPGPVRIIGDDRVSRRTTVKSGRLPVNKEFFFKIYFFAALCIFFPGCKLD